MMSVNLLSILFTVLNCILGKRQREITFFKLKVLFCFWSMSFKLYFFMKKDYIKLLHLSFFTVGEKFRWFFENVEEEKVQYSCSEVCDLIER